MPDTRPDRLDTVDVELLLLADADRIEATLRRIDRQALLDRVFTELGIHPDQQ